MWIYGWMDKCLQKIPIPIHKNINYTLDFRSVPVCVETIAAADEYIKKELNLGLFGFKKCKERKLSVVKAVGEQKSSLNYISLF